jgi:hypothetical protein
VATDPNAAAVDTHVDGVPFTEDSGVDNDEQQLRTSHLRADAGPCIAEC